MAFWFRRSARQTGTEGAGASLQTEERPEAEETMSAEGSRAAAAGATDSSDDSALREFLRKNFLYEDSPDPNCSEVASGQIGAETIALEPSRHAPLVAPVSEPSPPEAESLDAPAQPDKSPDSTGGEPHPPAAGSSLGAVPKPAPEIPTGPGIPASDESLAPTVGFGSPIANNANHPDPPPVPASDWAFEEKLASHKEWIDSKGLAGRRASFTDARLQGAELISVNLRYADLHAANMQAADLLLADLRDTCLTRVDLEESCLVGANLEAANLEGASLHTAMGLVNRQLAGANLRDASLPEQILEFPALEEFAAASRATLRYFSAILGVAAVSALILWKTKDLQLIADSSILPFLHSSAAAKALPTDELFLILPVLLFILYAVFQFHLQRVWDSALELPAIFPDGLVLGEGQPRIVVGLLRAHFRWMNQDAPSTRFIEKAISVCLGYWLVPAVLVGIWARYLTRQDLHGTALQSLLAAAASGIAFYATVRIGRRQERWIFERKLRREFAARVAAISPVSVTVVLLAVLTLLSAGTIEGIPHDKSRAPQFASADVRRWAPTVFWSLGFDPYPDLTEAAVSIRPPQWTGEADRLASVQGARLSGARLRYAQAYGAFLVNAHLWGADVQGAFMSQADLRGADLSQASLSYAVLESANLKGANLNRSRLNGANLERADLRYANLSYAALGGATLVDAQLQGASLYGAQLPSSNLRRANLEKADLRDAQLVEADLSHADLQQAYLWSAKLSGVSLEGARLGGAIFISADLRSANLSEAQFAGTVMNDANLGGALLDGADLRGALGLTAKQVCSAASRSGALLDPQLEAEVNAQCGSPSQSGISPR